MSPAPSTSISGPSASRGVYSAVSTAPAPSRSSSGTTRVVAVRKGKEKDREKEVAREREREKVKRKEKSRNRTRGFKPRMFICEGALSHTIWSTMKLCDRQNMPFINEGQATPLLQKGKAPRKRRGETLAHVCKIHNFSCRFRVGRA